MKCYSHKWLTVLVSLIIMPSIVCGQHFGSAYMKDACSKIIEEHYDDLNKYIKSAHNRIKYPTEDLSVFMGQISVRFERINSKCISPDYSYVTDDRRTDLLTIREYLSEIERYVYQSKKIIKYKIIDISDYKTEAGIAQMLCSLKINGIRCKAVFRINGDGKIVSITVDRVESSKQR